MPRKLGGTPEARRRVVVLADQGASSLSNVIVAILVARSVGAAEFGAFGVAMVVYSLSVGAVRALTGEGFINSHSVDRPSVRRRLEGELIGATVLLAVGIAVVVGTAGAIVGGPVAGALAAMAVGLPLVLVQDTLRYVFVIDRAGRALLIDTLWLVLVVAALPLAPSGAGAGWYVLAWSLSGGVAAVVGCAISGADLRAVHPWRWLARSRVVGSRFLGEYVTAQASAQLPMLVLGAISGLPALGAVRASQVFYGPLNTIHAGVYLAVVPEGTRMRQDVARLARLVRRTSALLGGMAAVWMLAGALMPDSVGRQLFDRTWPGAEQIMVPMGLAMIAGGVMSGGFLGIRSLSEADASLRARILCVPGQLVLPLVGAVIGDAVGFALGLAVGRLLSAVIWWATFRGVAGALVAAPAASVPSEPLVALPAGAGATEDG